MWRYRNNRTRNGYGTGPKIQEDEKLVAFRISKARYNELKSIAASDHKPVAQFINEAIDEKLRQLRAKCSATDCGGFLPRLKPGETSITCPKCGKVNVLDD
jgi:predicted DNA-binding protein